VLSGLGFAVGLVAALILALYQDVLDGTRVNLLIALMAGMPFLAAVRSSYAQRISERELIAQYAHMHRIYGNAQRLLARSDSAAHRRAILLALGIEALDEVGLWLLRQRERPVAGGQLFHGG
jgi:hypothetical protein